LALLLALGTAIKHESIPRAEKSEPAPSFLEAQARTQWRFGGNYVPQHYGNWQFKQGNWNFGADGRIECEACGYTMYMLIDRLGDEFNHQTVSTEMGGLCPRVQWVFRSACEHITKKHGPKIINAVMRLTEPEDICKQLTYCAPSFYDSALRGVGGQGYMHPMGMMGPAPGMVQFGAMHNNVLRQGVGGGMMGPGMPGAGFGYGAPVPDNLQVPTQGYGGNRVYPQPGTRPMSAHHPYSPYSFGGYDAYGYPYPHPGVPSATPPPPASGEGEAKA
jgi:hypothetical protein